MLTQAQLDAVALMKRAQNILIIPSYPIDGDSIGSGLALYLALKKLGKKATVVAEEPVPASYEFLPETSVISNELNFVRDFIVTIDCRGIAAPAVRQEIQGDKINIIITPQKGLITKEQISFGAGQAPYDCIIAVDAADPSQFGKIYENSPELFHLAPIINIDHHVSNVSFGKINAVDPMAASTTMLVLPLIEELGVQVDADMATLLLAGIITDTGSFQNPNTTPDSFSCAAKLIGLGGRQQEIIRNIYKTKKLSTLRLWGRTLTKLQYDTAHKIVWSVLTAADFAEIGGSPDETEGVIDELMSNAPNTEIIFLIKERGPAEVSASFRTVNAALDASKIAAMFGGGGHQQAAGCRIFGKTVKEVEEMIVKSVREFQAKRLGIATAQTQTVLQTPAQNATAASPAPMQVQPTQQPVPAAPTQPQQQQNSPFPPLIQ